MNSRCKKHIHTKMHVLITGDWSGRAFFMELIAFVDFWNGIVVNGIVGFLFFHRLGRCGNKTSAVGGGAGIV